MLEQNAGLNHVGVTEGKTNERHCINNEMAKIHDELEAAKQKIE